MAYSGIDNVKKIDHIMQSIASEAYKKSSSSNNTERAQGEHEFKKEYLQVLVKDYFYSGHQTEMPKDKLVHLQKLKASIDSLQLPNDFIISTSTEDISLGNFVELLKSEMENYEDKKDEKLEEQKEKLKNLKDKEIENIVVKAQSELTIGDIEKLRRGEIKISGKKTIPTEIIGQIKQRFEKQGIDPSEKHIEIAKHVLEKGVELSDTVCHNIDELLTARNKEISQDRIKELAENYASVQKISLSEWNKEYPLTKNQLQDLVNDLNNLGSDYLSKIGRNFKSIEEALDNYHNYKDKTISIKSNEASEISKSQLSFQYVRYKMTLEKAMTMNQRGIPVDKAELITIERELLRLELSNEQLNRIAADKSTSTDAVLDQMLDVEHNLINIMGADYGSLSKMMSNFAFNQVSGLAAANQAVNAIHRYDNLGTKVRSDLGDSMNKAFQHINSLLLSNGIEVNDENIRAVQILARGQVDINQYNINQMKELDQKLQLVLRGLSPEGILQLMQSEQDILSMTIDQLAEFADNREAKDFRRMSDRVASKINRLAKNGEIDSNQKEQLILVYRLLNSIEKSDGAAMAVLMKDRRELNLENLYDMAKFLRNQTSIDQRINSETGLNQNLNFTDLKTQIRNGYLNKKQEIHDAFKEVEQEMLGNMAEQETALAKERLDLLKNYSFREWEELFRTWQEPTMKDAEIYKEFQKIPFIMSDSLRKLEKASQSNEKAKEKLEILKNVLSINGSKVSFEQVRELLRDIEAEVINTTTVEEKEILSAVMDSKKQWDYDQKLSKSHEFLQVPIWTGNQLRQINIYYPEEKRKQVKDQAEIRVLLSFETDKNNHISAFLSARSDKSELIFQEGTSSEWVLQNKEGIRQAFYEHQIPLTSLSLGSFLPANPYHDNKDIKEITGSEILLPEERVLPEEVQIADIEVRMVDLAKALAKLIYK